MDIFETFVDENQHDVFVHPSLVEDSLIEDVPHLQSIEDFDEKVRQQGLLAVHLRRLNRLDEAEELLISAIQTIHTQGLSRGLLAQNKIRLGHVVQYQGFYNEAIDIFYDVISTCMDDEIAAPYEHFAWQHLGRCLFDDKQYVAALTAFEKALAIREELGDKSLIESTLSAKKATALKMI